MVIESRQTFFVGDSDTCEAEFRRLVSRKPEDVPEDEREWQQHLVNYVKMNEEYCCVNKKRGTRIFL